MSRYIVQSQTTGRFLVPCLDDGTPEWVTSLREAGGGVISDFEAAAHMAEEYAEIGESIQIINLDRLGTFDDY